VSKFVESLVPKQTWTSLVLTLILSRIRRDIAAKSNCVEYNNYYLSSYNISLSKGVEHQRSLSPFKKGRTAEKQTTSAQEVGQLLTQKDEA